MAGEWIPLELTTPRKREIGRIALATGRTRHEVLGLLVDFWCWASTETDNGAFGGTVEELCLLVGGDIDFWTSVMSVGWLEVDGAADGKLVVPRADHWISNSAKSRLKKSRRQQKWREGVNHNESDFVDADAPTKRLLQNRTEQNITVLSGSGSGSGTGATFSGSPASSGNGKARQSAFVGMTPERLRDIRALRSWLSWQATLQHPVLDPHDPDSLVRVVAAADKALQRGKSPERYFASVIGRKSKLSDADMDSARKRLEAACDV